ITRGYVRYEEVEARPEPLPQPPLAATPLPEPPPDAVAPEGSGAVVGGLRAQRLSALLPRLRDDLSEGRSVLVIAPENTLANEAAALLATRLPVRLLTGEASEEQRVALFAELPSEPPSVLVGSYIALLAPLPNLGRIVLLESSNGSYKLRSGARLAVQRAAQRLAAAVDAKLTFTDVVASPELVAAVDDGQRVSLPLPNLRVHVADLSASPNWPLHPDLQLTLRQVAMRDRQAIVIAARRGYSGAFGCYVCGWLAPCPNCDLTLRYHREEDRLRCHQCGHDEAVPVICPQCGGEELGALRGAGTQWVASQLGKLLPEMKVYRYDSDRRDDLTPLYEGEPGVVAATTAALRLAPLPKLSLAAIALFDVHLALADFRAEQEAVRMLLQLAELAGGPRPLVLVQTYAPDNEALLAVASQPPDAALEVLLGRQLERRKRFGYPPFATLAKVQLSARERSAAANAAASAADTLRLAGAEEGELLGPESAPVARVKGRYAYQLLLRATSEPRLETLIDALPDRLPQTKIIIDVDPSDVGELLE
ncbi:MAG TPA: primosomal protein N', partial [Trueperaceae bacterium]|nr:primosomal protein N' [Trueperaceae bacterium]